MTTLRLPGLVDVHTHMRDPGQTHKEDWASGTAAALAGGFTTVLAMPNTEPPVTDAGSLSKAQDAAAAGARVDFGLFAGGTGDNVAGLASLADRVVGLKLYLDETFGRLRLADLEDWWRHLEAWPADRPLAVHAEGPSLGTVVLMAHLLDRRIHLCHVSRRDEILLVRRAKEAGIPVTCEVTPHHLFLTRDDVARLGAAATVRPPLAAEPDVAALWEHMEVIDCFATDHAPHTRAEKTSPRSPPGFPGLETALALLLGAVADGRIALDEVVRRWDSSPRRIYGLPEQQDTWIEVDPEARWTVRGGELQSRCGWTPFEGMELRGIVQRVVIRGSDAVIGGSVLAAPGSGVDVRRGSATTGEEDP